MSKPIVTADRRLGQWSPQSRIAFDGRHVVWAYRKQLPSGESIDRVYAADVRAGKPWLRAARPTFDLADRTVSALKVNRSFAAWTTTKGTVMAAAERGFTEPATETTKADLKLVGAGTAGALGLVDALAPVDHRLLIGKFDSLASPAPSTLGLKVVASTAWRETRTAKARTAGR